MDNKQILDTVLATVVPAAQSLVVNLLGSVTGAGAAAPLVQGLIASIENLRVTTQPIYPDSWAGIHLDWANTVAQWRALNPTVPTRIVIGVPKPIAGRPDHAPIQAGRPDH